jgi:thiol-disulfide isomerase/thioredoxin
VISLETQKSGSVRYELPNGLATNQVTAAINSLRDTETLKEEECIQAATIVNHIWNIPYQLSGVPDASLPMDADQLPAITTLYPISIIYIWRKDCNPCKIMKQEFNDICSQKSMEFPFFSVYGPDWSKLLYDHYDVTGAPTTLFMRRDEVDARLTGAHYHDVIVKEVEKIRELGP